MSKRSERSTKVEDGVAKDDEERANPPASEQDAAGSSSAGWRSRKMLSRATSIDSGSTNPVLNFRDLGEKLFDNKQMQSLRNMFQRHSMDLGAEAVSYDNIHGVTGQAALSPFLRSRSLDPPPPTPNKFLLTVYDQVGDDDDVVETSTTSISGAMLANAIRERRPQEILRLLSQAPAFLSKRHGPQDKVYMTVPGSGIGKDDDCASPKPFTPVEGDDLKSGLLPDGDVVRSGLGDPTNETHYIIVIHGTFNSKIPGEAMWYLPAEGQLKEPFHFCTVLQSTLSGDKTAKGNWDDAVWRKLPLPLGESSSAIPTKNREDSYPFSWNSMNSHEERIKAAKFVAELLKYIGRSDPSARVHMIGHSHGGNVMLKAIEIYITHLRKVCREESQEDTPVARAFWAHHKKAHSTLKRSRSIQGTKWNQICMVWRPWLEESGVKGESYPWGINVLWDRILLLGRWRQSSYLSWAWSTSPVTNCLGGIITLGTPFYVKKWEKRGRIKFFSAIIFNSITAGLFISVLIWFLLSRFDNNPKRFNFQNRLTLFHGKLKIWHLIVIVLSLFAVRDFQNRTFFNGNLYHHPRLPWSPTMHALIIHASKLDEAALGLSTEPLVRAYLFPQLKNMLWPQPSKVFLPVRCTTRPLMAVLNIIRNIVAAIFTLAGAPLLLAHYLFYICLGGYLSDQMLRLLVSFVLGLQKSELDYAKIAVSERLDLDPATHRSTHWNIQSLFLQDSDPSTYPHISTEESSRLEKKSDRYKFLWDDNELERRTVESQTMMHLKEQIDLIDLKYRDKWLKDQKLVCAIIEERLREIANIELAHGGYFKNEGIQKVIAHFLQHRELPQGIPGEVEKDIKLHPSRREENLKGHSDTLQVVAV